MDRLLRARQNRVLQQEAVAQLGQTALAGCPADALFREAVRSAGRILQADYCEVLELLPENVLVLRATLPESAAMIGSRFETGTASLAGYALLCGEPVVMADIAHETRFTPHPLMRSQGIVCGVTVIIRGRERPFGVLNALSTRHRIFDDQDTYFLRAVANILGAAIDRIRTEDALQRSELEAKRLAAEEAVMANIGRIITSTLKIEEVYEQFAAEVRKILPFDRIAINIVDADGQTVTTQYVAGLAVDGRDAGDCFAYNGSSRYPGHLPVRRAGIHSTLLAPLIAKGTAFGALVLMAAEPGTYTERDVPVAESVAAQISGAIAHARLLQELIRAEASLRASELEAQRLARDKALMAEVSRILGSTLTIEDVYTRFSEEVRRAIAFDRITVTRIDPEGDAVRILYTSGPEVPERRPPGEYRLSGTLSETILRMRKGVVYNPSNETELRNAYPTILPMWEAGFRSFLLAPLILRGQVTGALVLSSLTPSAYGAAELALSENIASQISGAIANAGLFAEHQQLAENLRRSEASLRSILRICEMLGYSAEELEGRSARILYPSDEEFEFVGREKYLQIKSRGTGSVETRWQRKNGDLIDVLLSSTPLDPNDWSKGVTFTALDITAGKQAEQERVHLEDRLRQAQKMEAIGTLAGGIAHDFNNILAAIIGFAELARIVSDGNAEVRDHIDEVLKASFRARDLVRQILTFSRRTESEYAPVDVHLIVREALKLLRATLPSTIELRHAGGRPGRVLGDPTQIHQIVMNLCTNAYQAMPQGGTLEVTLEQACIDESHAAELRPLEPGPCLKLSVRDTGHGIDPAIMHRIFDPYFSTKDKTKGTGLGLAVVHGAVKAHKGAIRVTSRLGEGTTFEVLLPLVDGTAPTRPDPKRTAPRGYEHILFVDDEPSIAALGRQIFEALGYRVTTSRDPADALALFKATPQEFNLVITDMTMPGMTGDRLALELMRTRPGLPVIVCTGFNENIDPQRARELGIGALVMKPFLKDDLAALVRNLLDR
ncbi:MAG: GAF domain-containing protein [Desulfobacterales bacterium]|nr:GAF domain-containing protein [Desulfobacterales bacterium]